MTINIIAIRLNSVGLLSPRMFLSSFASGSHTWKLPPISPILSWRYWLLSIVPEKMDINDVRDDQLKAAWRRIRRIVNTPDYELLYRHITKGLLSFREGKTYGLIALTWKYKKVFRIMLQRHPELKVVYQSPWVHNPHHYETSFPRNQLVILTLE